MSSLAKIKELIADSPVRPHLGKQEKAPLWIPRKDEDYIVVTCPECLRSSTLPDTTVTGNLQETECVACGSYILLSGGFQHPQIARRQEEETPVARLKSNAAFG